MEAKNTANEIHELREYSGRIEDVLKKLKLSDLQVKVLTLWFQFEKYNSYNEGLSDGQREIQSGLKALLGIEQSIENYLNDCDFLTHKDLRRF